MSRVLNPVRTNSANNKTNNQAPKSILKQPNNVSNDKGRPSPKSVKEPTVLSPGSQRAQTPNQTNNQSLHQQLILLESNHRSNAAKIKQLMNQLNIEQDHARSMVDYLSAEEHRKQRLIDRLVDHVASIKQQQARDTQAMLDSFEQAMMHSQSLYAQQANNQTIKHQALKQSIASQSHIIEARQSMEQEIQSLKETINADQVKHAHEIVELKQKIQAEKRELLATSQSIKEPNDDQTSEQSIQPQISTSSRLKVVQQISAEKTQLLAEWSQLKHDLRSNQEKIDGLSINQSITESKVRELRREVGLIQDQLNEIPLIYSKRTVAHHSISQSKDQAANALGDAMINQSIKVDTREHEELQLIEYKKQQLVEAKSKQRSLEQLEKKTRAYANTMIKERQEAERCMVKLVQDAQSFNQINKHNVQPGKHISTTQDLDAEECRETDSPSLPTYYSDLTGEQREKLVKILFYRLMRHRTVPRHMVSSNQQLDNSQVDNQGPWCHTNPESNNQNGSPSLDQTLAQQPARVRSSTTSVLTARDVASSVIARARSGTAPSGDCITQKQQTQNKAQFAATINML